MPQHLYPLTCWQIVVSITWILSVVLQSTLAFLCVFQLQFSPRICPGLGLPDHMEPLPLGFYRPSALFSTVTVTDLQSHQSCRRFPLSSQNMPQLLLIATDTFIAQELIIIKEKTNWDPLCIGLLRQTFPFSSIDISFIKKKMVKLINWCWKVQLFRQLHGFISVHLIQTNFEDHRATSNFLRG